MSPHIFREYDIRGVAERDLTDDVVERIGRGIAELLGRSVGRGAAPRGRARLPAVGPAHPRGARCKG